MHHYHNYNFSSLNYIKRYQVNCHIVNTFHTIILILAVLTLFLHGHLTGAALPAVTAAALPPIMEHLTRSLVVTRIRAAICNGRFSFV